MYPNAFWVPRPQGDRVWWDGYDGEDVVIFDEFQGWCRQVDMQRYLDYYPLMLEFKGGSRAALYTKVVILSNYHPAEWWSGGLLPPMKARLFGDNDRVGNVFVLSSRGADLQSVAADDPVVESRVWPVRHHRN